MSHPDMSVSTPDNCPGNNVTDNMPPFQSYHVHVIFHPDPKEGYNTNNPHNSAGALRLRAKFQEHFGIGADEDCTGLFHQGRLCVTPVDWIPGHGFATPFTIPNWSAYVPVDQYAVTAAWIHQHRGEYDVLIHPNSGCMAEDHLRWSSWSGDKWEMNMAASWMPAGSSWGDAVV